MAVLTGTDEWSPIYKIDTSDPVKGGTISGTLDAPTDGYANAQAQSAANRFLWLYNRMTPIGSISAYGGTTAPTGWLLCNGSAVSRTTYASLFAVIGESFGEGNGTTTFNVPDFRGRFLRGVDNSAGVDPDAASRTAMASGGNTGDNVGSVQDDAFEAHSHTVNVENGINGAEAGATPDPSGSTTPNTFDTGDTGGNETRPKNAYVNYIIRADY